MDEIIKRFKELLAKTGIGIYKNLSNFFEKEKEIFYEKKIAFYKNKGNTYQQAVNKARQGWVATVGRALERVIEIMIEKFCEENKISITYDRKLRSKKLSEELEKVKRNLLINFGEFCFLPDGDIILYRTQNNKTTVLAIISVKGSFRERYTETPYWKLKLSENPITKNIKVFMVTPDNDDEISFKAKPQKARIVMEYDLDGIYLAKKDFDESENIKSIEKLIEDLEELIK